MRPTAPTSLRPRVASRRRLSLLAPVLAGLVALLAGAAPASADPWPGGSAVTVAAEGTAFGANLSGLAYQPSGTAAPGVLWAVDNGPSVLWRLVWNGAKWAPDTANGWSNGKQLFYQDGSGVPDAEGITLVAGNTSTVFVSTERNDSGKAKNGGKSDESRPAVLSFDVTGNGATINATRDWNLTPDISGLPANAGLEAVAWVPDSLLTSKGFVDQNGTPYVPAAYPGHGSGLFFVGVENDGRIIAYALDQAADTWTRVTSISSAFAENTVMDLSYDADNQHLWAACDDHCQGHTATLDIAQTGAAKGTFVATATYDRPSGMDNLNNEGFTFAPNAECAGGVKPAFWSNDDNLGGVALHAGTISCTVPLPVVPTTPAPTTPAPTTPVATTPAPSSGSGGGSTTTTGSAPSTGTGTSTGTTTSVAGPSSTQSTSTGPTVKAAITLTASGKYAIRSTGKFGLALTLGAKADVTISASTVKSGKTKARTLLKPTTKKAIPAGPSTITLTLAKSARIALRKGTTIKVTVLAKDASGHTTTATATAKVK